MPRAWKALGDVDVSQLRRPLLISTAAVMMLLEYQRWQDGQRTKLGDAWEDQDGRVFTTNTRAPIFPDSVPLAVSKQLGHMQTSTTANIYTHAITSAQTKAMQTLDRFNDLVSPGPTPEQAPESKKKAANG